MITEQQLLESKMSFIVKTYNEYAAQLKDVNPVKKFSTKKVGVARVLSLIDRLPKSKPKPKPSKKQGSIKSTTIGYILDDMDDKDIVQKINDEFPDSKFNFAHISWYRSTLFKDGLIGPEHAPRRSKAYKQWKLNNTNT